MSLGFEVQDLNRLRFRNGLGSSRIFVLELRGHLVTGLFFQGHVLLDMLLKSWFRNKCSSS